MGTKQNVNQGWRFMGVADQLPLVFVSLWKLEERRGETNAVVTLACESFVAGDGLGAFLLAAGEYNTHIGDWTEGELLRGLEMTDWAGGLSLLVGRTCGLYL